MAGIRDTARSDILPERCLVYCEMRFESVFDLLPGSRSIVKWSVRTRSHTRVPPH